MSNYSAVWRPGTGAQRWVAGYTFDQLKAEDEAQFAAGSRMRILRKIEDNSYLAVWRSGSGGQHWWAGISHDEWHPIDADMVKKGYRLTALDYQGDVISAVYHPGSGAQYVHGGITFEQLQQLHSDYFSKGLRLVTMERMYSSDWNELMAVWRSGTGGQYWYSNTGSSWEDFKQKNLKYYNEGYRLIAFPPYAINGIWSPGTGAQWVDFAVSQSAFESDDAKYFKEGLRLVDLSVGFSP